MKFRRQNLVFLLLFILAISVLSADEQFDHSYPACANFLVNYVRSGWVDYKGIDRNSKDLDEAVAELESVSFEQYEGFERAEKLAYLINAYNIFTVKAVMDNFPLRNIKEIPGAWKKSRFKVGGRSMSVDILEDFILRPRFGDPRVFCALTRASISGPLLWNKPFTPDSLEYQLDRRCSEFLHDTKRNQIDPEKGEFRLSQIFEWFGDDFIPRYSGRKHLPGLSKSQSAVVHFVLQYFDETDIEKIAQEKISLSFIEYNWNLNIK